MALGVAIPGIFFSEERNKPQVTATLQAAENSDSGPAEIAVALDNAAKVLAGPELFARVQSRMRTLSPKTPIGEPTITATHVPGSRIVSVRVSDGEEAEMQILLELLIDEFSHEQDGQQVRLTTSAPPAPVPTAKALRIALDGLTGGSIGLVLALLSAALARALAEPAQPPPLPERE